MKIRPLAFALASLAAALASACAFLDEPSQCATDADCARFAAVCNTASSLCVGVSGDDDVKAAGTPGRNDVGQDAAAATPADPRCAAATKDVERVPGSDAGVSGTLALGCEKDWTLDAPLIVGQGATLTIAAGTTIRAQKGAAVIVLPGGRILAQGSRDAPIVFTGGAGAKPGDWRGVVVLGRAPRTGNGPFDADPQLQYGGDVPDDDSGVLSFVRVEYAQSGVAFGGVGRTTKVDSIQVRQSNDNCFVFNGGTVNAKHLVCQQATDEQFEIGSGFVGKLQFLFGQRVGAGDGHHGLLLDGQGTAPSIHNVTLCGQSDTPAAGGGLVFRNGAKVDANNLIVTGWRSGIDAQSAMNPANVAIRGAIVFGNAQNPASDETGDAGPAADDDNGFDEVGVFRGGAGNAEANPNLVDCHDRSAPKPWPRAALTAGARAVPADDFLDANASYIGAFKDENDAWMTGAWVRFDAN